jgi:glutaredoxin
MITSETPYKLAEIIRDTWPNLYKEDGVLYNRSYPINNLQNFTSMKFTVYSKDGCPYCTKVQQVLELAQLQHVVYKLNTDFTREEFYAEFGEGSTFPQVIVNDQHIGGCTDTVQYLKEQNLV